MEETAFASELLWSRVHIVSLDQHHALSPILVDPVDRTNRWSHRGHYWLTL